MEETSDLRRGIVYENHNNAQNINCGCCTCLYEAIRVVLFKCFGYEMTDELQNNNHLHKESNEEASCSKSFFSSSSSCSSQGDVKETDPLLPPTTQSDPPPSADEQLMKNMEDIAVTFQAPPRPPVTRGRGPQTNSSTT